jgi:hypothetical protein
VIFIKVFSLQDEAKKAELQKKFNEEVLPGLLKNIGNYLIKINSLLFRQLSEDFLQRRHSHSLFPFLLCCKNSAYLPSPPVRVSLAILSDVEKTRDC